MGHGVSTCATCDGFFYRNRPIAVVGGGDSALEEAIFLTKFASKVTLIHRRDTPARVEDHARQGGGEPEDRVPLELGRRGGQGRREGERDRRRPPGHGDRESAANWPLDGVFVAIGHTPNTSLFAGQLELDDNGYIVTHDGTHTNVPGVFACGDVQDHVYRQAITAAGSGCMAALDAERCLERLPETWK